MPTFALLSDLHNEFGEYPHPFPEADLVVLAGDIHRKGRGPAWAARKANGRPVLYVPGNHEAYGDRLPRHIEKLQAAGEPLGVTVAHKTRITVGRVRVLATTLWTDFNYFGTVDQSMREAGGERGMRDYQKIRLAPTYRKLRPQDTRGWHAAEVAWLAAALAEPWDGPTMVVTHHAPHDVGSDPIMRADAMNAAYVSHLGPLMERFAPEVWVHGHTHYAHDTMVGRTRVLSNPFGYPDDRAANFRPDLVITLG